jgi:hypothetical protein
MSNQAHALILDLLKNYRQVRHIRSEFLSRKMRPLTTSFPKYKLFDFEHPYFEMDEHTAEAVKSFEQMIKRVLDVEIDGSTVRKELEKIKVFAILSSKPVDEYVAKLLKW